MNTQHIDHKKIRVIGIAVGVILALVITGVGWVIFQGNFVGASGALPQNVTVTDITTNSVKVSWMTDMESQGVIEYGTSPTSLNFFAPENAKSTDHMVDLTLLSPASTYYFQIRVADKVYDNQGVPWSFATKTQDGSGTDATEPVSAVPTVSNAQPTALPTAIPTSPISQATIAPTAMPTSSVPLTCDETDCEKIKEKFGKGCDVEHFLRCIKKVTPSP